MSEKLGSHGKDSENNKIQSWLDIGYPYIPNETATLKDRRPELPSLNWKIATNSVSYLFGWYGIMIAKFPTQIMVTFLFLAFFFTSGFYRFKMHQGNLMEGFMPTNSRAMQDRLQSLLFEARDENRTTETHMTVWSTPKMIQLGYKLEDFTMKPPSNKPPPGRSEGERKRRSTKENVMNVGRQKRQGMGPCRQQIVIIVAKENPETGEPYNLYTSHAIDAIRELENTLWRIGVTHERLERYMTYTDLCARVPQTGHCAGFGIRILEEVLPGLKVNEDGVVLDITYPTFEVGAVKHDFSKFFGGVELEFGNYIKTMRSMRLFFCLAEVGPYRVYGLNEKWEASFDMFLSEFKSDYFEVGWKSFEQDKVVTNAMLMDMIPRIAVSFAALFIWCCIAALAEDVVASKPWCGLIGIFSTGMASSAGMGIMFWMDKQFYVVVAAAPLLTLAIGLDDMFILLGAWGRTSSHDTIEVRMMTTMMEGGTSIFITFLINIFGFIFGSWSPYEAISVFSNFSLATMTLDFIFQMTIFASSLSIFGSIESFNAHSVFCIPRLPTRDELWKRYALDNTFCVIFKAICCSGGVAIAVDPPKPENSKTSLTSETPEVSRREEPTGPLTRLVEKYIAPALLSVPIRVFACLAFICYFAGSIYLVLQPFPGLQVERLYPEHTSLFRYARAERLYYQQYGPKVDIIIKQSINYSDPDTQFKLNELAYKFTSNEDLFWSESAKFWWVDFWQWTKNQNLTITGGMRGMVFHLRRPYGFLSHPDYTKYQKDIRIKHGESYDIVQSRSSIRSKDQSTPERQIAMMEASRRYVDSYLSWFKVIAYTDYFKVSDQYLTVVPTALYYTLLTIGCTAVAALVMLPHPICMFWAVLAVISTILGITGMTTLWGMSLDSVTQISILIAVGFCADFIVHATYSYLLAEEPDYIECPTTMDVRMFKCRKMLECVIIADLPAGMGTCLAIIGMATVDAYIFFTFFRILFLAVILSFLHAAIFLPVILSFFGPVYRAEPRVEDDSSIRTPVNLQPDGPAAFSNEVDLLNDMNLSHQKSASRNRRRVVRSNSELSMRSGYNELPVFDDDYTTSTGLDEHEVMTPVFSHHRHRKPSYAEQRMHRMPPTDMLHEQPSTSSSSVRPYKTRPTPRHYYDDSEFGISSSSKTRSARRHHHDDAGTDGRKERRSKTMLPNSSNEYDFNVLPGTTRLLSKNRTGLDRNKLHESSAATLSYILKRDTKQKSGASPSRQTTPPSSSARDKVAVVSPRRSTSISRADVGVSYIDLDLKKRRLADTDKLPNRTIGDLVGDGGDRRKRSTSLSESTPRHKQKRQASPRRQVPIKPERSPPMPRSSRFYGGGGLSLFSATPAVSAKKRAPPPGPVVRVAERRIGGTLARKPPSTNHSSKNGQLATPNNGTLNRF